jgi:drug/metabolite transporter (DMT)-like permease
VRSAIRHELREASSRIAAIARAHQRLYKSDRIDTLDLGAYGTRASGDWLGFTSWLILLDSFAFLAFSRIMRGAAVWSELLGMKSRVIVSGCLGVASFCVFLWALSRNSVGAVSAVRETSVLFAMLIGAVIYNEPMSLARLAAGSLVVAGIVTIAIWR